MAYHLSIFMENKIGKLERITKIIADEKLTIRGITLSSNGEFGIVKILTNDPDRADKVLRDNKLAVSKRPIIAVRIDDVAGSLNNFLNILSKNGINIEDCYGVSVARNNTAIVIIETEKFPDLENVLKSNNITMLSDEEIYSL